MLNIKIDLNLDQTWQFVLLTIAFLYAFWGLFVLSMGLYKAYLNKLLTPTTRVLAAPYILAMAIFDLIANYTIFLIVFLQFPSLKDFLVTYRLRTILLTQDGGYRYRLAKWLCDKLLNPFDPRGNHCLPPNLKDKI